MQMVHIEDNFVEDDGSLNLAGARGAKHGFAILSILFRIDPRKPQVRWKEIMWQLFHF